MDVVTSMRAPSFNILCFEGVGRGVALWYLTDDAAAESTFEGRNRGQRFPRAAPKVLLKLFSISQLRIRCNQQQFLGDTATIVQIPSAEAV
jgi:hypothetical protein